MPERPQETLSRVAHAYSSFAADNPALYDAMFHVLLPHACDSEPRTHPPS